MRVPATQLRPSRPGRNAIRAWITPSLKPAGREKGLFQVPNANLEGIVCTGPGRFVLCAERQPRGFVEVDCAATPIRAATSVIIA